MKIDVYQEQYKSKQAYHQPGQIGFGYNVEQFKELGNTLLNASVKKMENDDAINSARIEADTMLAADKLYREYQKTANPDTFEQDIEGQRSVIQNLIKDQSKQFRLPKSQQAFTEKMTRGLEEQYIGNVLTYSYNLQEDKYKQLGQEAFDSYKAQLLAGNTFLTVPDVMNSMRDYYTQLADRYNIPKNKLDAYIAAQNNSIITSYAYGMIDKNPTAIRDLLVGTGFDKFKAYKESLGEAFDMDTFWQSKELQDEYKQSEFGAQYVDIIKYLDYEQRVDLWKAANQEISRQEKEALKQKFLQNSASDYDLDRQKDAAISQANANGTLPTNIRGTSKVTFEEDSDLGTKNMPISMGKITKGPLAKGNSFMPFSEDFAGGISGNISGRGYNVVLTSNLRPGDKDSKHVDGSAVDISVNRNGKFNPQGAVEAYKAAVLQYKNNIKKGGVLFEVDKQTLNYIKSQLEADGVDTSFINWKQSEEYGAKAEGPHIHFTLDKNANYKVTSSGAGSELIFQTQHGKARYLQQRSAGKSVQAAYDAARKDEFDIMSAVYSWQFLNGIITTKNADGTNLDPAYYGQMLQANKNQVLNNKSLSNEARAIQLAAIEKAEAELPKLQEQFMNDPVNFLISTNQAKTPEEAQIVQLKQYGISSNEVLTMTDKEAAVKASQLTKMPAEDAVAYIKANGTNAATLRQIAKHMPNDSKTDMLMYSAMASPAMTSQIIEAYKDWDNTDLAIKQHKELFPTNWRNDVIGKLKKDPTIKNYIADIEKTQPIETTKMLDTMASLYAYRMTHGATNPSNTLKDIAQNLIGVNFNSVTVNSPRQGNTQINVAKGFDVNALNKIKRVSDMIGSLGVNGDFIGLTPDITAPGYTEISRAVAEESNIERRHQIDSMIRTSKLSGTPDGLSAMITWQNPLGLAAGSIMYNKMTGKPLAVKYSEMVQIYNEAYKLKETWKKRVDNTGRLGGDTTYTYNVPKGKYYSVYGTSEANAMSAALEQVITNKYDWVNPSDYTLQYKGNIDLYNRPRVRNKDTSGRESVSTVRSMSYSATINGKQKHILIPTVSNEGKIMNESEAIKYWRNKNQYLGIYDTKKEADRAAYQIHKQQAKYYGLK